MTMQARGNLGRYGAAVVFVALATGLRLVLEPFVGDNAPYAFGFAAVAAAAWYGGLGPAVLATVLGGGMTYYLIVPRQAFGAGSLPGLFLFLLASATVLGLSERLRREWQRAEDAEARERAGRERVETTLRSIGDAVITTDAEGRVTFLNLQAERLTGWPSGEAAGQPLESVFRVLDEQTRQPVGNVGRRALHEGRTVGLANRTVLLARGGGEAPIDDSAAPITGSDGRSVGVVLVFRSVEPAREAERERERLSEKLESLIDNTPLAVVEWDGDFRVRRWSGEAEAVFGWKAEEVVGRRIDELRLVHEDDEAAVREVMARLLDPAGRYVVSRNRNRTKSGETRSCEWYNSMFHDQQGRLVAVLSLVLDVTERERLEATLRQSDRHKDEFLATLAHELRNPLAPMRNALEIMRLAGPDSGAAERARALIERQLAQMVRLIDDLLDVSRISRGQLELRARGSSSPRWSRAPSRRAAR